MNKQLSHAVIAAMAFVGLLGFAAPAKAQFDFFWNPPTGGSGNWEALLNWSTLSTGPNNYTWLNTGLERANFGNAAGTVTLGTGITAYGANFSTSGYVITGNTLTLAGAGGVVNTNAFDATINSILAGSVGLTKNGAGTLSLGGANNYTGVTNLNAGVLAISTSDGLGAVGAGNETIVATGGTLQVTGNITITEAITLSGSGTSFTGALRKIGNDTTTFNSATITLAPGGADIIADAGDLNFNAGSSISGAGQQLTMVAYGNITIAGSANQVNITTGTLTKWGTGVLTIANSNANFVGNVNIMEGVLAIPSSLSFGANGTVTLDGGTLRSTTTATTGSLIPDSRPLVIGLQGGTIDISASSTAQAILAGLTTVDLGANTFTKVGPGILAWNRNSIGNADIHINEGTLRLRNSGTGAGNDGNRIPDSSRIFIASGATFDIASINETVKTVIGAGTITGGSGSRLTLGGNFSDANFSGQIVNSMGLTKIGNDHLFLSGNNTYTGTTIVNGGWLVVNGTHTGTGTVTVNTTARLSGTGSLNSNVNIMGGATLSPGKEDILNPLDNIATLTVNGTVTISTEGSYFVHTKTSGSQADLIKSNSLILNSPYLAVSIAVGSLAGTEEFLIAQNITPGTTAVTGTFAGLPNGSVFASASGQNIYIYYDSRLTGGTITPELGSIILTPVPEPTTILAVGALAFGMIHRLRRRDTVSPLLAA